MKKNSNLRVDLENQYNACKKIIEVEVFNFEQLKKFKSKHITNYKILIDAINEIKVLSKQNNIESNNEIIAISKFINLYKKNMSILIEKRKANMPSISPMSPRVHSINPNLISGYLKDIREILEDIKLVNREGKLHPLTSVSKIVEKYFLDLNFKYSKPIQIEDIDFNFNHLNISKAHPSRKESDTFYIDKKTLLRTHATNMTSREIFANKKNQDSEIKSFSIGPVYRNDYNDNTHSFQFNQIDIIFVRNELSVSNLKWIINNLLDILFEQKLEKRYRISYFPFTEPSFEVDIKLNNVWIEILGTGFINKKVYDNLGYSNKKIGIAAGIGLERLTMLKYNIANIRDFYENRISFLKNIKSL